MTVTWLTHRRIDRPSVGFVFDTRHAFFGMDFSLSLSLSYSLVLLCIIYFREYGGYESRKQQQTIPQLTPGTIRLCFNGVLPAVPVGVETWNWTDDRLEIN